MHHHLTSFLSSSTLPKYIMIFNLLRHIQLLTYIYPICSNKNKLYSTLASSLKTNTTYILENNSLTSLALILVSIVMRLMRYIFLRIVHFLILIRHWYLVLTVFHRCYLFQILHCHSIFSISQVSILLITHSCMIIILNGLNQLSPFFSY